MCKKAHKSRRAQCCDAGDDGVDPRPIYEQWHGNHPEGQQTQIGNIESEEIHQEVPLGSIRPQPMADECVDHGEDMGDGKNHEVVQVPVKGLVEQGEDGQPEEGVVGTDDRESKRFALAPPENKVFDGKRKNGFRVFHPD